MKSGEGRDGSIVLVHPQTKLGQASFDEVRPGLIVSCQILNDLREIRSVGLFVEIDWREPYGLSASLYQHP